MFASSRKAALFLMIGLSLAACESTGRLPSGPRAGEPAGIVGLNQVQLKSLFGAPAFERQDGAARLWRYDGAACKAFFFFQNDGGKLAVRHVETVPRGSSIAADITCLDALRASASRRPLS